MLKYWISWILFIELSLIFICETFPTCRQYPYIAFTFAPDHFEPSVFFGAMDARLVRPRAGLRRWDCSSATDAHPMQFWKRKSIRESWRFPETMCPSRHGGRKGPSGKESRRRGHERNSDQGSKGVEAMEDKRESRHQSLISSHHWFCIRTFCTHTFRTCICTAVS